MRPFGSGPAVLVENSLSLSRSGSARCLARTSPWAMPWGTASWARLSHVTADTTTRRRPPSWTVDAGTLEAVLRSSAHASSVIVIQTATPTAPPPDRPCPPTPPRIEALPFHTTTHARAKTSARGAYSLTMHGLYPCQSPPDDVTPNRGMHRGSRASKWLLGRSNRRCPVQHTDMSMNMSSKYSRSTSLARGGDADNKHATGGPSRRRDDGVVHAPSYIVGTMGCGACALGCGACALTPRTDDGVVRA